MYKGKCVPHDSGTVHVVAGMGGHAYKAAWRHSKGFVTQPKWSVFRSEQHGFCRLHATHERLVFEYVTNTRLETHDSLTLLRGPAPGAKAGSSSGLPRLVSEMPLSVDGALMPADDESVSYPLKS